jgi:hypothetical protein
VNLSRFFSPEESLIKPESAVIPTQAGIDPDFKQAISRRKNGFPLARE